MTCSRRPRAIPRSRCPVGRASEAVMFTRLLRLSALGVLAAVRAPAPEVPLVTGLRLVSALHTPDGDRENVVVVASVSAEGVQYRWDFKQRTTDGRSTEGRFNRFVRANDMAGAPRLNPVFQGGQDETPGYTVMVLSRATYNAVRAGREVPYSVTSIRSGPLGALGAIDPMVASMASPRLTFRGSLRLVAPAPEPVPVLLNGKRVNLPAMHLEGRFALQDDRIDTDLWVLADSVNPLVLRSVTGTEVLQMVRIDLPNASSIE